MDLASQASRGASENSDKNFEMDDHTASSKITFLMTEKLFNLMVDHSLEVNAYLIQINNQ